MWGSSRVSCCIGCFACSGGGAVAAAVTAVVRGVYTQRLELRSIPSPSNREAHATAASLAAAATTITAAAAVAVTTSVTATARAFGAGGHGPLDGGGFGVGVAVELYVQVRRGAEAGVTGCAQRLPAHHPLPHLHQGAAGLHVDVPVI